MILCIDERYQQNKRKRQDYLSIYEEIDTILGTRAASNPPLLLDSSKFQNENEEEVVGKPFCIVLHSIFNILHVADHSIYKTNVPDPALEPELVTEPELEPESLKGSAPLSRSNTPIDQPCSSQAKTRDQISARKRGLSS